MRQISYFTIILALLLTSSIHVSAQNWKVLNQQAVENKTLQTYPYVNLWDSTSVQIAHTGSGAFTIHRILRIQNTTGALQNRVLVYDYDPLTAEARFSRITLYRKNGAEIIHIDPSQTADYVAPARMIYWGARQIMIEIGALEPGDVIDYEIHKRGFTYALLQNASGNTASGNIGCGAPLSVHSNSADEKEEDRFIPPMKGEFYDIVPFWSTMPTLYKIYRISIPRERDMQYQFFQGTCTTSVRYQEDRKVYTFSMKDMMPPKYEPNRVDLFDCAPKLVASSTPDWKEKSVWFHTVNEAYGSFKPTPAAEKKVDEILKGKKTEMEKIAALTHWVADNIRYSGITMGKGEGYTLHNLDMNFTDRCGVCKDIAGTLVGMLRIAGFKAYPAMTMAGSRIDKEIPADHFNHCVTVVQLSDSTLMPLDPTWVPFCRELWSSAEQQQNYLPGLPEGSDLCQTPVSAPENHYLRLKANTTLSTNGTLSGTFTVEAEGQSDLSVRRIFTTGWQTDWYNYMEQQLLAVSPRARMISVDWGKDPKNYTAAPIRIVFRFEIPDYALKGEKELIFKPLLMENLYSRPRAEKRLDLSLEKRDFGFSIPCSQLLQLQETITLPKGYKLFSPERKEHIENPVARFNGEFRQEGQKLIIKQELALTKRIYQANEWKDVRNAVQAYRNFDQYLILKVDK